MPVNREQKQFSISPIGVNRASNAGQITSQAIIDAADQMGNIAYKAAARKAEKSGIERGKSVSSDELTGIDPATGGPVALNNIKEMGTIQADAYERIVNRRFEESIEQEVILKSKELALKHENPSTYESLMSDYLSEMSNNATGQYSEFINNTGAVYLNKTKLALQDLAIQRAKAAQKAAEVKAAEDRKNLSFELGRSAGSGDTQDAVKKFYEVQDYTNDSSNDVATFTGDPSVVTKSQLANAESFLNGYAPAALVNLSPRDRTNLRMALQFPTKPNLSVAGQSVYDTIVKVANGNGKLLAELGKGLADEITWLNSVPTEADIALEKYQTDFVVKNQELSIGLSNNEFELGAYDNLEDAHERLNQYPLIAGDNVDKGDFNAREADRNLAEEQLLAGGVLAALKDVNLSEQNLADLKSTLGQGDASLLYSFNPDISDSRKSIITDLLNKADPKQLLSVLESQKTYQAGQENLVKQSSDLFIDSKLDSLEQRVLDGEDFEKINREYNTGADASDKYEEGLVRLKDAFGIRELRSFLVDQGLDANSKEMLKEVKLLASGTAVDKKSTPILNQMKITGKVKSLFKKIGDVDARKKAVGSILDVLPKDRSKEIRAQANEDYNKKITELTSASQPFTSEGSVERRNKLVKEINSDSRLEPSDRTALIAELDQSIAVDVVTDIFSGLTDEEIDQALAYVSAPSEQNNLSEDIRKKIDSAFSNFASTEDRNAISSKLGTVKQNILNSRRAVETEEKQAAALAAVNNGGSIPNDPESVEFIQKNLLRQTEMTAPPSDMFTNTAALIAASKDPSNPRYRDGLFTSEYLKLSSRILMPEAKRFLEAGIRGGRYAGKPIDIENFADVVFNIAADQDPQSAQRVRTEILVSAGFTEREVGVFEGIVRAREAGVPSNYLDDVAEALRSQDQVQNTFEASAGTTLADFVMDASDMWFKGDRLTGDLQIQREMQEYALGLYQSGMRLGNIKTTIQQHMSDAYYSDSFTVNASNPSSNNTRVGLERALPNQAERTAALQLFQISMFEQIGSRISPDATPREQIEAGKVAYQQQNQSTFTSSSANLGTIYAKTAGQKRIVFIPSYSSTNQNATFTPYLQNDFGEIEFMEGVGVISTSNPQISMLAARLNTLKDSGSLEGGLNSVPDAAIEFYLGNKKP